MTKTPTFAEWFRVSNSIRRASGVRLLSLKAAWAIWNTVTA